MTWPTIPPILLTSFKLGVSSILTHAPDGSQVIEIGTNASVDLGISPAQLQAYPPGVSPYVREGTYTLSFDVMNVFPKYPGEYDVQVAFGTQQLCEAYGWGKEGFTTVVMTCPGPGYIVIDKALPSGGPVQSAHNLVITVTGSSWQMYYKNFSLTFTPIN